MGGDVKSKSIPDDIRKQAEEIVDKFNRGIFRGGDCYYVMRIQGKYLYLDRCDFGKVGPICRLTYKGKTDGWGFAIFKWSSETYDPEEWMFPGSGYVDGTIEGAMKAGLDAYPA